MMRISWRADGPVVSRYEFLLCAMSGITPSSQERMFGEGQLPVTQDDITALEVLPVDGLLLGLRLSIPAVYGVVTS